MNMVNETLDAWNQKGRPEPEVAMKTDWGTVRAMMAAAIDTCETIEALGYCPDNRAAVADVDGKKVSAFDIVTSAFVLPENVRYAIIRARHETNADLPYVPETARILLSMAQACAELVGAEPEKPADRDIAQMVRWYSDQAIPRLRGALRLEDTKAPPGSLGPDGLLPWVRPMKRKGQPKPSGD